MKISFALSLFAAAILISGTSWYLGRQSAPASAPADSSARKVLFYQSPMHPWIKSDQPGKCTICGMALAPVYEGEKGFDANDPSLVSLSEAAASVIGVASTPAKVAPLHRALRVAGIIDDDETRHRILSARVPGRIEKLHVNQIGVEIAADQPLATLYSPEALTAQRLYLENFRLAATGAVSTSAISSSREKLLLLGLTDADIRQLETTKKPLDTLVLRAPFAGTVISRNAYEGQYVKDNDALFEIGDFSSLWFVFDAYERDLASLSLNQSATVTLPSLPGEKFTAPIAFIDPNLDETTRTARVRVVLPNPQRRILHRQTADGIIHLETAPTLLIPRSAILHTRQQPVAYVDLGKGNFQLRQLTLGKIGDTDAEVLQGIKEGEKVVTQAALLLDGQAQLAQSAVSSTETASADHTHHAAKSPKEISSEKNHAPLAETTSSPLPAALIESALRVTEALAADDFPAYQKHLPALRAAIHQTSGATHHTLSPLAEKLVDAPDLKTVRRPFEPFSNTLADLVRAQPAAQRPAKIFQCPMTPVLGTARWLQQSDEEVRNPFFGADMLNCGEELK